MANLIILRGPTGSGKSSNYKYLKSRLRNACSLDLDITAPHEDNLIKKNVESYLDYDYVIGLMFYGNSHTKYVYVWITNSKPENTKFFSVILYASKDECYRRCRDDPCPLLVGNNREEKR